MTTRPIENAEKYTGPCLKASYRMAKAWGLDDSQAAAMTGIADLVGTHDRFLAGEKIVLRNEQLYRISAMLCVWKHIAWRFTDNGSAWLREPNAFYQDVPLTLMTGSLNDICDVRDGFDRAEAEMLSGYQLPAYPVKNFVHPAYDMEGPRFGRTDGGPGHIATDAEIDASLDATSAEADPVVMYLRDK